MSDAIFEEVIVEVEKLTREETLVLKEAGAVVERSLVIHGCQPQLKVGDVIVEVNDQKFVSREDLTQLLTNAVHSGANFKVLVKRPKGPSFRNEQQQISKERPLERLSVDAKHIERFIFEIRRDDLSKPFGLLATTKNGYVCLDNLEGLAKEAGLQEGDHVVALNNKKVVTLSDLESAVQGQTKIVIHVIRSSSAVTQPPPKTEYEEKSMSLQIPYESGDILGVKVDKNLVVTDILAGFIDEGKFEINDRITEINGIKVTKDEDFYRILRHINDNLSIGIIRTMMKQDARGKATEKQTPVNMLVMISLAMSHFEPLGVRTDEKMLITAIQSSSHAEGKFEVGDVIKLVNGVPVKDGNQFFKLIEDATATGRVNIVVERSAVSEFELEVRQLPPNIEEMIKRRDGFDYVLLDVKFDQKCGRTFGLCIADVTLHKTIVTEVAENTVAGDYFKEYDHIIAINGTPISNTMVAEKIIRECRASFQAVIERPVSVEATAAVKKEIEEWKAKLMKPASPENIEEMPLDVQDIVRAHLKRRENRCPPTLLSLLRKRNVPPRRIQFAEKHTETEIQSDVPPTKQLKSSR